LANFWALKTSRGIRGIQWKRSFSATAGKMIRSHYSFYFGCGLFSKVKQNFSIVCVPINQWPAKKLMNCLRTTPQALEESGKQQRDYDCNIQLILASILLTQTPEEHLPSRPAGYFTSAQ
jgi:hypothetical protein